MLFKRLKLLSQRVDALEEEVEIQREIEEYLRQAILFLADVKHLKPEDWTDERRKYISPIVGHSVICRRHVRTCEDCGFEWEREAVEICPRCKKKTTYVTLPSKRSGARP